MLGKITKAEEIINKLREVEVLLSKENKIK